MSSDQVYRQEPLIKSPWRQFCGCIFFVILYIVIFASSMISGQPFQLTFSIETLVTVIYMIFFILLFFLPQSILDRIGDKFMVKEIPLEKEILTERAETDIDTDRAG